MRQQMIRMFFTVLAALTAGAPAGADGPAPAERLWLSGGHDVRNTRHASAEAVLDKGNVAQLVQKWMFKAGGNVLATPAVDDTAVYFPDQAGNFYKVDRDTGVQRWMRSIAGYTGGTAADVRGLPWSRTTPIVTDDALVIGTRDAYILAIDKSNGELIWKTKVDTHPAAIITASPVLDSVTGRLYVGVSSFEEQLAAQPNYVCCSFRGSALALDIRTGKILWQTYSVPEGYSGGPLLGSTPAIDHKRGLVYFTTGNNYSVPRHAAECATKAGQDQQALQRCTSPRNYFDAVLALDSRSGAIKWGHRLWGYDTWSYACMTPGKCPPPDSPDYDFCSGANFFTTVARPGQPARDLVGVGQKSGIYWALDPSDGSVVWKTQVGPGGFVGGIQWGSATDGRRVYVAIANWSPQPVPHRLKSGESVTWGFYSALDAATGEILWQTADPTPQAYPIGMVSVANAVMYAGSFEPKGHYYALDGETGSILWRFPSGGAVVSGAAIVDGRVYWGTGFTGGPSDKVYAFALP